MPTFGTTVRYLCVIFLLDSKSASYSSSRAISSFADGKGNEADIGTFTAVFRRMFWKVGNHATVTRATNVEVEILADTLCHPRAPAGSEVKDILAMMIGDRDFRFEARSPLLLGVRERVVGVLAPANSILSALFPRPNLTPGCVAALVPGWSPLNQNRNGPCFTRNESGKKAFAKLLSSCIFSNVAIDSARRAVNVLSPLGVTNTSARRN